MTMLEQYLVTFGAISLVGLLVMILGLKASANFKRALETLGAIAFHVGIFGILYHKVDIMLFMSLVALVLSLFVLIDPLKLIIYIQPRAYRITGLFLLFTSIAFSTMYFTGFPVWLWSVPLVIYLLPYTIMLFKRRQTSLQLSAWLLIVVYLALVSYSLYSRFYPNPRYTFLVGWFAKPATEDFLAALPMAPQPDETETVANGDEIPTSPQNEISTESEDIVEHKPLATTESKTDSVTTESEFESFTREEEEGPFLRSLKEADEKYVQLKRDYERLNKKYNDLEQKHIKFLEETREQMRSDTEKN
jgi:hypothetical protein